MPETTKAVPFLSDERMEKMLGTYIYLTSGHTIRPEEAWRAGALDVRRECEAELTRLRQLVEEARVALVEEYERLESRCNEDGAFGGRDSYWVRYYRDFQRFLVQQINKLPKPPQP